MPYFDVLKAKRDGHTDAEIQAFMQQNGLQPLPQTPATPVQPAGMTTQNAPFNTPVAPTTAVAPENVGGVPGFLTKVGDFLLPRSTKLTKTLTATPMFASELNTAENNAKDFKSLSDKYYQQGLQETDPVKKDQLFKLSMEAQNKAQQGVESAIGGFETRTGTKIGEKQPSYAAQAIGVGGEIGTYFMPQKKLTEGATLVQKILSYAIMGGKIGTLMGATTPEDLTLKERGVKTLQGAGTGTLTGAVTGTLFEAPKAIVQKVLGNAGNRITRIFQIPKGEQVDFQKSTGGMDFGNEILKRDGQNIAGMGYDEMANYFAGKKQEAMSVLDSLVKDPAKTVSKKKIIDVIDSQLSELKPEKGFLESASGGLKATLESIKNDLSAMPEDLQAGVANRIKQQLQEAGDAAFSATGKTNTASSAFARVSTGVKSAIEDAFTSGKENPIRDANKAIQLYSQAGKSIELAGKAQVNKVSADMMQKFLQFFPTVISAGAGYAGYRYGGAEGGVGALVLAQALMGGAAAARIGYLSPETQTAWANATYKILKSQGVKNADKLSTAIAQQISNAIARNATSGVSNNVAETGKGAQAPNNQPFQGNANQGQQNAQGNNQVQIPDTHAPSITQNPDEVVTITNDQTGETKQVKKSELPQYGLGGTEFAGQGSLGISNDQILAAIVLDMQQTGGKNMSKLTSLLSSKMAVDKAKGGNLTAIQQQQMGDAKSALGLVDTLETAYSELQKVGLTAKEGGIPRFLAGAKGEYAAFTQQGTEGAAAGAYKDSKGAFLSTLARAFGEKGVLTDPDVARAAKAVPSFGDTPEKAARQWKFIREVISQKIIEKQNKFAQENGDSSSLQFAGGQTAIE